MQQIKRTCVYTVAFIRGVEQHSEAKSSQRVRGLDHFSNTCAAAATPAPGVEPVCPSSVIVASSAAIAVRISRSQTKPKMTDSKDFTFEAILTASEDDIEFLLHHTADLLGIHCGGCHGGNGRTTMSFGRVQGQSHGGSGGTGGEHVPLVAGKNLF